MERGHFIQPKSGESAIDDIETLGAPVRAFVRDCCVVGADESVTKADLFQTWKHWCMDENRKDAGTKEWFSRNLHATEPSVSATAFAWTVEKEVLFGSVWPRVTKPIATRVTQRPHHHPNAPGSFRCCHG